MTVFAAADFDGHEQVAFVHDRATGLRAIIAVHDTTLGPGAGGVRFWPYADDEVALADALRLSRGMTYKSALAGLPFGGGKSVIIGDPRRDKSPALMAAFGSAVDRLGGAYIAAEDVGTTVADMDAIATSTRHVAGTSATSGDPSPWTAFGVFEAIRAAVRFSLGRADGDVAGLTVALQGLGAVGFALARRLHDAGAHLVVADVRAEAVERAVAAFGARPADAENIHRVAADIFAPCALGAGLNDETIPVLGARIVAGSANNQLAAAHHGAMLARRGVLYAPDYVANAGGIVEVAYGSGFMGARGEDDIRRHVAGIHDTLLEIFARAGADGLPTAVVANRMAEARFRPGGARRAGAAA
ncbi:MAG: Glu/Leu/Phe/Val dehydrogenase [Alphaproteobacteria bacterium]|nr:Glu/Leu/Phe/Val dehydrogenase [Alphaproteobacteria bacterium]